MEIPEILKHLQYTRSVANASSGFDWNATLPAPFGVGGWFMFRLPHPDIFRATDRVLPRDTAESIHRFASTFCTLAVGTDTTPYTNVLSQLMEEDGVEEAAYFPRLALPLIVAGLSHYASTLGGFLHLVIDDPVTVPISLMHIWALGEASRIQTSCICAGGNWPDTEEDAAAVLRVTQTENLLVHKNEEPYKNVFLESFDDVFKPKPPQRR